MPDRTPTQAQGETSNPEPDVGGTPVIQAFLALDCASKVRIRYRLPRGLSVGLLQDLGWGRVQVQEFSKWVDGAQDLCSLESQEPLLRLAGTVGEPWLVATFGKLGSDERPMCVGDLDRRLTELLGGPVEYMEKPES